MKYDILITTVGKNREQLLLLLNANNIFGNILIGNQGNNTYSEETIFQKNRNVRIFNLTNKGVSRNRNFLLKKATSDFVLFLDDDVRIINNKFDAFIPDFNKAYRFNLISENRHRPIKQINGKSKLAFKDLKSFGVWGIFFPRKILVENKLNFNELVGPGCSINHGEDSLFIKDFLKVGDIYQVDDCCFSVSQIESTWQGDNRDIIAELISHGFVYGFLFGCRTVAFLPYHLFKKRKMYGGVSFYMSCKIAFKGYKLYKEALKKPLTKEVIQKYFNQE